MIKEAISRLFLGAQFAFGLVLLLALLVIWALRSGRDDDEHD
jgi:hypothetical protein